MGLNVGAKRWTSDEDAILRSRYASSSAEELSVYFGRSLRSVRQRINRIGLTKTRKWTSNELAYLLEHSGKMPHAEIASVLGVTQKAVSKAIERYGMTSFRRYLTEHEQRRFKNLYTRGWSDLKISRKMKITKVRVMRHRLRLGLPGHGFTNKSWSARVRNKKRETMMAVAANKVGVQFVSKDELVSLAMKFTEDDDEMLSVVWESMQAAWTEKSTMADMSVAAQEGLAQFRRETFSYMSADSFVDEDGNQFEMAESQKVRGLY